MNPPLLSVRGLGKDYGNGNGCFGVDFELYSGEVLCVVGESGSGKSTLLAALAGKLAADAGSARFRDRDGREHELTAIAESERRRRAANGASCPSTPATACAWTSPPAPISASG